MKVAEQRRYKEVLQDQVLPMLTNPQITDNDMISMYGKTKLEIAITYLELLAKKNGVIMANWVNFSQYEGYAILDDASKIRTPDGVEHTLTPGKLFYFINPNTGVKNFAKPDVLLVRAMKSSKPRKEKKVKVLKEPKPKKEKKAVSKDASPAIIPYRREKIKSMGITGREAIVKAIATGCEFYYNTPRWGWIESKHDPKYILSRLDSSNEDLAAEWPVDRWGIK